MKILRLGRGEGKTGAGHSNEQSNCEGWCRGDVEMMDGWIQRRELPWKDG